MSTINKGTTIGVSIVLILLSAAVTYGITCGTQGAAIQQHVADDNVHWTLQELNTEFVPRGELLAEMHAIRAQLDRIENKVAAPVD